jgi:single-strand DNA-binding protein
MARGFNKVILLGNLTRDPELRTIPSGQTVCGFSLAVNRSWKNAEGETQEAVDYVDCNAWGKAGELINQYMQKGRAILVSGRLQQRSWEQDGQKRNKIEVVVEDFNFVGGPGEAPAGATATPVPTAAKKSGKKDEEVVIEDIDDEPVDLSDIPF